MGNESIVGAGPGGLGEFDSVLGVPTAIAGSIGEFDVAAELSAPALAVLGLASGRVGIGNEFDILGAISLVEGNVVVNETSHYIADVIRDQDVVLVMPLNLFTNLTFARSGINAHPDPENTLELGLPLFITPELNTTLDFRAGGIGPNLTGASTSPVGSQGSISAGDGGSVSAGGTGGTSGFSGGEAP